MKIVAKGFSIAGPTREANEDTLVLDNAQQIFMVADGMGGHVGGARASQSATEVAKQILADSFEDESSAENTEDVDKWEKYVRDAISSASQRVFKLAHEDNELRGMGTTLTSFVHRGGNGIVGHVGDSRLYLYRGGVLNQLTQDHTVVNELLESGEISPSQAVNHPFASVLTKAVGVHEAVAADTLIFELALGDQLFLCSDGFFELFQDSDELLEFIASNINGSILEEAEKLAETRTAQDNVSFALLEVVPEEQTQEADALQTQEVVLKIDVLQQVNLFQHLDAKEIVSIVQQSIVHRVAADELIVSEGADASEYLYIILDGEVEVFKNDVSLAVLGKGNHFGEISLVLNRPRSATVRAKSQASLLEIPKRVIEHLLTHSPRAGVSFLLEMTRELADRLAETSERAA